VRRFTAFQHIDQCGDFPRTSSRCLHVGGAKRKCIKVLPPQRLKRLPCARAGVDLARVAEELPSSLEESDEDVATAWAAELERRSRNIAEGRVQTISWDVARAEILNELEQRRASRTTS
jgi:putative addiction module component (TIGR02574 family)